MVTEVENGAAVLQFGVKLLQFGDGVEYMMAL